MKYILYRKELYIVKEPLTKNRTCQTWRGKQVAMSDDRETLEQYAKELFNNTYTEWYIEERP